MNKVEKAMEIIHLIKPDFEDFEKFPRKDEISMDMFVEVVSFMCGHVLSARLELTREEKNQIMTALMMEILENLTAEARDEK